MIVDIYIMYILYVLSIGHESWYSMWGPWMVLGIAKWNIELGPLIFLKKIYIEKKPLTLLKKKNC